MSTRHRPSSFCALLGALLLLALSAGCGVSANYFNPAGPRYAAEVPAGSSPPADGVVRIVTFNIEHGRRIDEALAILREYPTLRDPDVLSLQEMDSAGVEEIARALGLGYVYYPASRGPGDDRDMGNAILSPWPMVQTWKVPLPWLTRVVHRSRAATVARILVEGQPVIVYAVHFGSPLGTGPGDRRDQAQAVIAHAMQFSEPIIVAGDANSWGVGRELEAAGFSWPTRSVGRTLSLFSFDHVYVRGLEIGPGVTAGVEREASEASDHRPVWAQVRLAASPRAEPR